MSLTTTTRRRSAALLLGAALVTLSATACSSTGSTVNTEAKQPAATTAAGAGAATGAATGAASGAAKPAESKPADAAKAPAKVGDTIALKSSLDKANTADITVVKVVDPAESSNEYLQPEEGKRYVAVQFQIKATGSGAYGDSPWTSAKVVDAQGQSFAASLADTKAGPTFPTPTNIAPNETGKGFITFEVPKDVKLDKIQFAMDSGFASQVGQWKIG